MSTARQGFFRPIEITPSYQDITIDGTAYQLPLGLYESLLTLVYELNYICESEDANYHCILVEDTSGSVVPNTPRVAFYNADTLDTMTVTFTDDTLRNALGFDSTQDPLTVSPQSTETANYPPKFCWIPQFRDYSRSRFSIRHDRRFAGLEARNGRLSGLTANSKQYQRQFAFAHEKAENVREEAASSSWYEDLCFEYFYDAMRTTGPQQATTANPLGCYYIPDWTVYCGASPTVAIPSSMDEGGIHFDYSSSPDRYLFCHPSGTADISVEPSLPVGINYYNVSFTLHAASCPSWVTHS